MKVMDAASGKALSPANLEYERIYKVIDQPVLTFVARQKG